MIKTLLYSFCLFILLPLSGEAQFILNGSATTTSSACSATTYELTPDLGNEGGQIWYTNLYSLANPLDVQFQIFLGTKCYNCGGADGIGFVLQPLSSSAGSTGGGMGFGGISPSVDVEFDTYQNGWDPAFCHISIEKNGDVNHTDGSGNQLAGPVQCSPTNPLIPDGAWHSARIIWSPVSNTLKVYFDCSLRLTYTGDIINTVFGGNPNVYWGFTAGTGGGYNTQEVCITHSFLQNLRDTVICKGSSVTMTASGGATYSWTPAAGLNTTTGATVIATPAATTKYYVTITDACGIAALDSETIRVSNTVLTTTGTNTTCGNNNGTATVTPAGGILPYTFTWSNGLTTTNINGLSAGSYTVTSKDSLGCTATATQVIGGSPPLFDSIVSFTNVSVACGSNGTANVGVRGGATPYSYSWTNGQTVPNATNLSAGTYSCTVTDANGCTATTSVNITQPGALTATITGTTPALCNGGATGTATGSASGGTGPYTYSWNPSAQTTPTATALSAGTYTLSITDANGCTVTAIATVTQPAAIRDSIASSVNVTCNGLSNGTATAGVKGGTPGYTYNWTNGQTVPTATGLSAGSYTVNITDANGCPGTANVTITQPTVLTITAGAFNVTCFNACNGQTGVIPAGGTTPYSYSWNTGATTPTLTNLCIGTYTVQVTDANGCIHDTSLTITQPPAIVITKNPSTTAHCNQADGSASISAAGGTGALTYSWSTGANTTNITNVKPGNYCVTVTDANGCTDTACVVVPNQSGETASITSITNVTCFGGNNGSITGDATGGTAPYTYSWNPSGQTTPTATALSAGTYTLTVTDATGCQDTISQTVTQPALVVATTSPAQTICIGQTATIASTAVGGTSPYTFSWSNGVTSSTNPVTPIVTTTYTVNTVDVNGCIGAPVPVTITVDPPLTNIANPTKATCPGGSVTLGATGGGGNGGPYTYNWSPAAGLSCTTCQNPTASPAATTTYTVVVSDGCTVLNDSAKETVVIDPLPNISFTVDSTNGCYPLCVNFTDGTTIASGGLKSWAWSFGDGNTSTSQNPSNCYTTSGSYTVGVTVTSDSGCISTVSIPNMITSYSHPVASFTWSPNPVSMMNPAVQFTDASTDAYGVIGWDWTRFGDWTDSVSFAQNPTHTYQDTGTYCTHLIVVNKHGCIDSITECLQVEPFFTFYIPNSFTPNGDGRNDIFIPVGAYFKSFEMYIFDRWGEQIYHTTDIKKGWNGYYNNVGYLCQEETYVYLINVIDFQLNSYSYMGRVTLMQ